eukprot:1276407-Prymnesium_polylepis.1
MNARSDGDGLVCCAAWYGRRAERERCERGSVAPRPCKPCGASCPWVVGRSLRQRGGSECRAARV